METEKGNSQDSNQEEQMLQTPKKGDDNYFGGDGQSWKMFTTPMQEEKYRIENNQLRSQIKQLQLDVHAEQETVGQVRRRLNAVEKERLQAASKNNAEIADLEGQLVKFRAQIEKGEAMRQNLEFELTKTRREVTQQKHATLEKDATLKDARGQLEKKILDLEETLKKTESERNNLQEKVEAAENKIQRQKEENDHEIAKSHTEQEILRAERDKLDAIVLQQEGTLSDLQEKNQELENEQRNQLENLRRTLTEMEYAKEREDRLKKDLETALQRLRTMEESIEAERAAHLESKFNSEIVQLRVRDLEGAMEVEKSANNEANKAIDRLTRQIRELEHSYEEERKNGKDLSNKLDKMEREYSSVKKQLTAQVEDKKSVIGNLSKELEHHQKNFSELKDELTKAKKRQIYLEETYGGNMRELELLLNNFSVEPTKGKSKKDSSKQPNPSVVLESLRQTLSEYKKRLDNTSGELGRMKKLTDSLNREVDQLKEMMWAKDKSLEDAQKNYTRTAKELNRVRSEYGALDSHMARMKMDLQSTSSNQTKDRKRIHGLSEEIMKLVKRHKAEDEEKLAFLHGMHHRLLAGKIPMKEPNFTQFSWADLTSLVYEQVSSLVTVVQRSEEKTTHLEEALKSKEELVEEMQRSHEDQLNKLTSLTKEREQSWHKQKEEIEAHYAQLLTELQSRSKKSQAMADQAWDKIRMTGTVKQGLETECSDLRAQVVEAQTQNASLLAACGLLAGALFPMCSRATHLATQRHLLEEQCGMWDMCRERIELLVDTLASEMQDENDTKSKTQIHRKRHPLLVFRKAAIAVLAANRLRYLGRSCTKMFVTYDTSVFYRTGIAVCTGGARPAVTSFRDGVSDDLEIDDLSSRQDIMRWVSSPDLLHTVVSSMSEMIEVIGHIKNKDGAIESRALVNAARNTFTKLVDKIGRHFEGVTGSQNTAFRERNSLMRMMGRGLSKVCVGKPLEQRQHLSPLQDILGALQNHILNFTQRLHAVEIERRGLLLEVERLKEEVIEASRDEALKNQMSEDPQFVAMDKFESVCLELNNALRREQQAQQLLLEQGRQLEELTLRLDLYTTEGMEKEQILTSAVQGLAEHKSEMKKKEQTLRQLNRQVITLEGEKKSLSTNVSDAERALRTVARDKEILTLYIRSVEAALDKAKQELSLSKRFQGRDVSLSKMLLSADFIPTDVGKAGPELIACQNLVGAFVDAQQQAYAKIKALEEDVDSHKRHVTTLKQELSDAVRREYDDEGEVPTRDNEKVSQNISMVDTTQGDAFMPIKEDSEISFSFAKPSTPKSTPKAKARLISETPNKGDRSPKYQTPSRSSRTQNMRPKAFEPHGR
ncbi:coiled-coil domain-containing protein 171-like [Ylistrum balloti]|uniref:coiled-coil domain-containing protein 171-like n=1 Tax=Ylistrum balloti TaxID=509963 RepID=UPI002905E085|nr:coiled-coil domain-containing protein 171-like [Ylistrum balloti]